MAESKNMLDYLMLMEKNAEAAPTLEFTLENWLAEFGSSGQVDTPVGKVKMGENQLAKLILNKRTAELGMIKPTLTSPDVIVEMASEAKKGQETERPSSYLFVKTFIVNGEKTRHYESVTVSKDGMEVVVSNHIVKSAQLVSRLLNGNVLWSKYELTNPKTSDKFQTLGEHNTKNPSVNAHGSNVQSSIPTTKILQNSQNPTL
jgi:hypothetical protein